jgi:hypothetical protein
MYQRRGVRKNKDLNTAPVRLGVAFGEAELAAWPQRFLRHQAPNAVTAYEILRDPDVSLRRETTFGAKTKRQLAVFA